MQNIKAEDGKLYKVPVILIISDASTAEQHEAIYTSFFSAVEQVYGTGWGRKGFQWVYIDEWNIDTDRGTNPFSKIQPVGEEKCRHYDELLSAVMKSLPDIHPLPGQDISKHPRIQKEINSLVPKSAFPLPYLLEYYPTSQLATNDVPRNEQWKLMGKIIHQLQHKRTWIDAIFIDAVNHGKHNPRESYDASAVPKVIENIPVTIFESLKCLTELLIEDKVFLSVEQFILPSKN